MPVPEQNIQILTEQRKKTEQRKQKFKNNAKTASGFVSYPSSDEIKVDNSLWELRIAIEPTRENLNKAADLLAEKLSSIHPDISFKVLFLNDEQKKQTEIHQVSWDPSFDPKTDRNQRGKECCIFMNFDKTKGTYELPPEEWKHLLLSAWEILQDPANGIKGLGYTTASGDKAITTDFGLRTPFSVASNRPYKGDDVIANPTVIEQEAKDLLRQEQLENLSTQGNLNVEEEKELQELNEKIKSKYAGGLAVGDIHRDPRNKISPFPEQIDAASLPFHNPLLFADPLQGVSISLEDLKKYNINLPSFILMQKARKQETKRKCAQFKENLNKLIDDILVPYGEEEKLDNSQLYETKLQRLVEEILSKENNLEELKKYILKNEAKIRTLLESSPKDSSTQMLDSCTEMNRLLCFFVDIKGNNPEVKQKALTGFIEIIKDKNFLPKYTDTKITEIFI
jgi:hypothetical protein